MFKAFFFLKIYYRLLKIDFFLDYRFVTSQWWLVAQTYSALVRSVAAVEAGGGEDTQAGHATCTRSWLLTIYSPARWNYTAALIDTLSPTNTCTPTSGCTTSETEICATNIQSATENVGEGRERVAHSKQSASEMTSSLLSHRQSQRSACMSYLMTLTSCINIVCCMQARSALVSCISFLLGTWWPYTLAAEAMTACLEVDHGPK